MEWMACGAPLGVRAQIADRGAVVTRPGAGPPLEHDPVSGRYFKTCPRCDRRNGFREAPAGQDGRRRFELDRLLP